MSSERLISTVFVLQYANPFSIDQQYMGRAAHKIALGLINQVSIDLAKDLHNMNSIMPMSISDLFQSDDNHYWMRVTGLREDVVQALEEVTRIPNINFDGWRVKHALTQMHDWSGLTTVQNIIEQTWQPKHRISLIFETATCFKHKGLYRPLPDASLIFGSLYEKWLALVDTPIPYCPDREVLATFIDYAVSIRDFNIQSVRLPMKHAPLQAFKGSVQFVIEIPSRALKRATKRNEPHTATVLAHYEDLTCLLNLLVAFGFYSAIGIKTAQGLGMVRRG